MKYKCSNVGNCDLATTSKEFELENGQEVCPFCSSPKIKPTSSSEGVTPPRPLLPYIIAGVVIVLVTGAYFFLKPAKKIIVLENQQSVNTPSSAPISTSTTTVASEIPAAKSNTPDSSGISPSEVDSKTVRQQGEKEISIGNASAAEVTTARAISNELIKSGISKMQQGKLIEAEKDFMDAQARSPSNSLAYYNMAILRLKKNDQKEAIRQLERSFENGFKYFDEMEKDSDISTLKSNPDFNDLVKKYRK